MAIYCRGTAKIRHAGTGAVHEINDDEIIWEEVGRNERPMGPEMTYEALLEHEELGSLTCTVVEYPIGAENMTDCNVGKHQVIEQFNFGIESDRPDA